MSQIRSRLLSTGVYLPENLVSNKDLEDMMDTSDEWIQQRSGIKERRWVGPEDTTCSMAVAASKMALERANLDVDDIDAIIFGALVTDYVFPGTGCLMQKAMGFSKPIPALDIRNQCSGFLYGLSIADAWIRSGMYKRILLVGSEIHSTSMDKSPSGRNISVLFGDGAGAVILEANEKDQRGVIGTNIHSEGAHADKLILRRPSANDQPKWGPFAEGELPEGAYPYMDGKFVFKNAVTRMPEAVRAICKEHQVDMKAIDMLIPHQANMRINQMVAEQLELDASKVHNTIHKYGNTTMASIPLTLHDAIEEKKVKEGDLLALAAFGAGFTWGASLVQF